jgi:exopolyphosphatase/guanosine-5'-triphosphate,3'-diphosphate pyrophosphatase
LYSRDDLVTAARDLAASCVPLDQGHFLQVTRLALRLFDHLRSLHGRGEDERVQLQTAALLHDIGWADGQRGHHKNSMRRILREDSLPLDDRERRMVALIARYHRRALPKEKHPFFRALDPGDRQVVSELACLLRIADGLDYSHDSSVVDVEVQIGDQAVRIFCLAHRPMDRDMARAMAKGGKLFQTLFGRELMILWRHI